MEQSEQNYLNLVRRIINEGELKETRNGKTLSLFGTSLRFPELKEGKLPLLTTRKHFMKGIVGEYCAFLRGPKTLKAFEDFGCNYWKLWAEEDGSLNVDYGNEWLDSNGVNQVDYVIDLLKNDPNSRRMIIDAWNPSHVINKELSLECCHYAYQFHVSEGKYLNMSFNMRSVDTLIGMPSDIIIGSLMIITFAEAAGLKPGELVMNFGDTHIYEEHIEKAKEQIEREGFEYPTFEMSPLDSIYDFVPECLDVNKYKHQAPIKYELKA